MPQLSLPFPISERHRFEHFRVGDNRELVVALQALAVPGRFRGLWLYGPAARGKTHLLQALCHARRDRRVAYLPLAQLDVPELLESYDSLDLVALDDVDAWVGRRPLEEALVHLFTALRQADRRWVMASSCPPAALNPLLPDLASRFRSLDCYEVRPLGDDDKAAVLKALALDRGLRVPDRVLRYWLSRGSRDFADLLQDLERVCAQAVGDQRAITVPFLKDVLAL